MWSEKGWAGNASLSRDLKEETEEHPLAKWGKQESARSLQGLGRKQGRGAQVGLVRDKGQNEGGKAGGRGGGVGSADPARALGDPG